jgi:hypothetical protein
VLQQLIFLPLVVVAAAETMSDKAALVVDWFIKRMCR